MKLSSLIQRLNQMKRTHGDVNVRAYWTGGVPTGAVSQVELVNGTMCAICNIEESLILDEGELHLQRQKQEVK